jgi:hypothetical protein
MGRRTVELTKFSQNAQGMVDSHLRLGGGDWRQFCCFFEQGLLGWVTGHVKMKEKEIKDCPVSMPVLEQEGLLV